MRTRQSLTVVLATGALFAVSGVALAATINGTSGSDYSLKGTAGADEIFAGAGEDYADGYGGDDRIWGQEDNDYLCGDCSPFEIVNGQVVDHGPDGNDEVHGGSGNDQLWGGVGNDKLYAGDKAPTNPWFDQNALFGGPGGDELYGGDGVDQLEGGDDGDILRGYGNVDWLLGQGGPDSLNGGGQEDQLSGGSGDDYMSSYGDGGARDLVNCGTGIDRATLDMNDQFYAGARNNVTAAEAGCEHVNRLIDSYRPPPAPGPQPQPAPRP